MKYDIHAGVEGLIFDLDGTIVDTIPLHYAAWKNACLLYGIELHNGFLNQLTGNPSLDIASEIIIKYNLSSIVTNHQLLKEKMEEFIKLQHLVKPIPIVTDIVKRYFGILPMAIGTGGHRETVERTLEITDLRKYFDIIITVNDIENYKPHPETFLKCANLMGISPSKIEVFEDTDQGLEAARLAGMIATDIRMWYNV